MIFLLSVLFDCKLNRQSKLSLKKKLQLIIIVIPFVYHISLYTPLPYMASTAKITSFSECIFHVYLIQGCNQKISLYLVWKSIICSTKSLLNHPYIYFLKGEIHVLNLNRISVIRIDSLLIFCISKLICRDQNKIYNFHLLTSSRLSAVWDKKNNECFIFCNTGLQKE